MRKAFTLIELLIVVAIIGILATALVPTLSNSQGKARDVVRIAAVKDAITAAETYMLDKAVYPSASDCANTAFGDLYANADLPNAVDERCPHPYFVRLEDGYLVSVALEDYKQANSCYEKIISFDTTVTKSIVMTDYIGEVTDCGDYFPAFTVVR